MHLLPVYYTTTSSRKRKKQKKSKSLLVAEQEHAKYLKRMGVGKSNGGRSSVGRASKPWVTGSSPVESTNDKVDTSRWTPCTKEDKSYKLDISSQYVIGQAYNKGGLQVLSKTEQSDPTTGKRR